MSAASADLIRGFSQASLKSQELVIVKGMSYWIDSLF